MNWIAASLFSAVLLGCYNLSVKHAIRDNAVFPVLFWGNLLIALVWLVLMTAVPARSLPALLHVAPLKPLQHAQVLLKSALMTTSWTLVYFGLKRLPMSLAAPVQSTGPVWILAGAVLFLGESLSLLQWAGVLLTLGAFVGLSLVGAKEGVHFARNRAVWLVLAGTFLVGITGLYDRYLLTRAGFSPATVQAWFSIYVAVLFAPIALGWKLRLWKRDTFHWRWSIPLLAVFLLLADFSYYTAVRSPDALVSIVASLRRGDVIVAFLGGVFLFKEPNARRKLPVVAALLAGIVITLLG